MGTFNHALGLEDVRREVETLEAANFEVNNLDGVFHAQQTILSNIMVVSALLLGFIVTGTMLSIVLTGQENFGVEELVLFFRWSGLAAGFAFLSLITSFLTSVWGAGFRTSLGPMEAAKALTTRSTFRRTVAECSLYMSMFFFLLSLNSYVQMVYTGPDICPSYRGSASFCARVGEDLFHAATLVCKGTCETPHRSDCEIKVDALSCLCAEWCRKGWEQSFDFSHVSIHERLAGNVSYFNWFGYWSFGEQSHKAIRELVIAKASDVMCDHEDLEARKEECFAERGRDCDVPFLAWAKSEECLEESVSDAEKCRKVCSWLHGRPPREALTALTRMLFLPLGVLTLLFSIGRVTVLLVKSCRACREQHDAMALGLKRFVTSQDAQESSDDSSGTVFGKD